MNIVKQITFTTLQEEGDPYTHLNKLDQLIRSLWRNNKDILLETLAAGFLINSLPLSWDSFTNTIMARYIDTNTLPYAEIREALLAEAIRLMERAKGLEAESP